jgi:translation initiation factor IF-2
MPVGVLKHWIKKVDLKNRMVKKLLAVAKELNVGTSTIVDHLTSKGFDIANKPNARIEPEMYDELLKEFQSSISIKEKADKLLIGNRPGTEAPKPKEKLSLAERLARLKGGADKPKEEVPEPIEEKETPSPEIVEQIPTPQEEKTTQVSEKEEEAEKEEKSETKEKGPGLKVVGKVDLGSLKKPKKKAKKDVEDEPVDSEKSEVKEVDKPDEAGSKLETEPTTTSTDEVVEKKSSPKVTEDEHVKGDVPQLQGLKVVGRINIEPKKKKAKPQPAAKTTDKDKPSEESSSKRRRRKRTKVAAVTKPARERKGTRAKGREDVKEVSQKEIDEQIKATLARLAGGKKSKRQKVRKEQKEKLREKAEMEVNEEENKKLQVTEFISVSELASLMDVTPTDVIVTCMNLGVIVSINQRLDAEIIELVASEFDFETEFISAEEQVLEEDMFEDPEEDLEPRAPIVTVMGHVDHGKTSLLDYIRSAKVAAGEAGGITQHIGAYEVKVGDDERRITFLDTPGHEAFTAMRARGAKVTDVAVVIVAADDKIMPQTKEAISHAQAAGVPIVFAINKIDKPGADPERIKQELASMNYLVEAWGGKYQSQDISALKGTNVDQLLEKILLEADILELKANPKRKAIGTVIEASLDKGRGYVTKVLVQNGVLKMGDPMVAGEHQGKVKAMFNEFGMRIKSAGPSRPVLILGLSGAPQAGEQFKVMESESESKDLASRRAQINREQTNRASKRISLDEIGRRLALGTFKELNLIVKGDVDGSVEALSDVLIKLSIESVQVNVIHKAVGQIIESDVLLASASDAIIIGFQVRPSLGARKLAEKEGVQIKLYSIIYETIEEIKSAIQGMLEPVREEKITGNLEVRETYKISRIGTIAGCYVQDGKINRNSFIRVIRDGIVIYPTKEGVVGEISSLKRFKEDIKEVKTGLECGLTVKNFNDVKVGDTIEAYEVIEVKAEM